MTLPETILNILTLTPAATSKYLAKVIACQHPALAPELRNLNNVTQSLKVAGKIELVGNEWRRNDAKPEKPIVKHKCDRCGVADATKIFNAKRGVAIFTYCTPCAMIVWEWEKENFTMSPIETLNQLNP